MDETFNAYQSWLGFPPGCEPRNHYELLRLGIFETDTDAIARAADAATATIRSVRPGEHLAQWQQVLDHLQAVKACLMDPAAKAGYDAALQRLSQSTAAAPHQGVYTPPQGMYSPQHVAPVDAMASTGVDVVDSTADALENSSTDSDASEHVFVARPPARLKSRRPFWGQTLFRAGWLALLFVAVGLGFQLLRTNPETAPQVSNGPVTTQSNQVAANPATSPRPVVSPAVPPSGSGERPTTSRTPATSAGAAVDTADNQSAPIPRDASPVVPQQPSSESSKPAEMDSPAPVEMAAAPQADPASMAAFGREVSAARTSMRNRHLEAAAQHLKAAESLSRTPEQTAELSRLQTILAHLEEFWKAVRKSVAGLHSGQELTIQNIVIVVVEASKDQVVLRAQGRNYTYVVEQLPHTVALALAEMWLADVPSSKVFVGTFLTMEPKGNRERAQQVLDEARQAGLDVEDVLAELRIAPPSTATRSGKSDSSTAGSGTATAGKSPVPTNQAKLREAADQIHEIFRTDYAEANTPAGKSSLASKLLENAEKLADDPVARYVMLTEARDAATEAGDLENASKAVEQLGASYEIDALAMELSVLQTLAQNVRGLDGHRDIAQAALATIPQAVKQKRLDEAAKLADLAQASALKSRNVSLLRAARAAGEQIDAAKRKK